MYSFIRQAVGTALSVTRVLGLVSTLHRARGFPALLVLFLLLSALPLTGCGPSDGGRDAPPGTNRAGLEELRDRMTGSFSSQDQALTDSAFLDIRLHMVPIWPEEQGAAWLYVEQSDAEAPDEPYRQRVYRLTAEEDGTFRSSVFELPGDPQAYAGEWQSSDPLRGLDPADLLPREGCDVVLRRNRAGDFLGGTVAGACPSSLRGASYATTEVTIYQDRFVSWDRGFDIHGEQIWGSTAGGYEFVKDSG